MAELCTVADVAALLRLTIEPDDASALAAIAAASAAVRGECRQYLELVADDVVTLTVPAGRRAILLPERPVIAVDSVTEDGAELTIGDDYVWTSSGILRRIGRTWPSGWEDVVVTYTHGYAELPAAVVDVAARIAARRYQAGLRAASVDGITGIQGETLPDYAVTFSPETASGAASSLGASAAPIILETERRALSEFRVSV